MGIQLNGTSGTDVISAVDGSLTIDGDISIVDKIIHSGDTNTAIRFPAADTIAAETNGSERLRILSNGNIGIGTDTAPHKLSVKGTISKISGTSGVQLVNIANDGSQNGTIAIMQSGGVERIKLHSSGVSYFNGGQVSIGSATEGHADADDLTIASSGRTGMTIRSGSSEYGNIFFSDATSGSGEHQGIFQYYHADDAFIWKSGSSATERLRINSSGQIGIGTIGPQSGSNDGLTVWRSNTGNPSGITIRNTHTSNYSHGRLRIESQNGAKYTDIWTDVPNDCCRLGYNTSSSLNINNGNAYAKTSVSSWHNDYRVFQAGQASLSGKNPQDGSPLYLSNNAYYDTTNSRWEFISSDDASQIEMENGSIKFKNGGTGSANGAITWVTNAWFNQSGNLRFRNGRGIDFGETGGGTGTSNASEILTDYEHGEWTPVLQHYIGGGFTSPTYSTAGTVVGRYTKIGNMVHISASFLGFNISNAHGSSFARITGLPFTSTNHPNHRDVMSCASDAFTSNGVVFATYWNQTNLNSMKHGSSVFDWGVLHGGATDNIVVSGHYTAA